MNRYSRTAKIMNAIDYQFHKVYDKYFIAPSKVILGIGVIELLTSESHLTFDQSEGKIKYRILGTPVVPDYKNEWVIEVCCSFGEINALDLINEENRGLL